MLLAILPSDHACYRILYSKSIFPCPWFCFPALGQAFQLNSLVLQSLIAPPRSGLFYSFWSKAFSLNTFLLHELFFLSQWGYSRQPCFLKPNALKHFPSWKRFKRSWYLCGTEMHSLNTVEPELNLFFLQQLCFPSGCCNSRRAQRKIILSNLLIFWKRKLRPARSCDLPRLSQVVGKARRRNPVFGYHILLSCYSRILQSWTVLRDSVFPL